MQMPTAQLVVVHAPDAYLAVNQGKRKRTRGLVEIEA
jgi:hypothetical protein